MVTSPLLGVHQSLSHPFSRERKEGLSLSHSLSPVTRTADMRPLCLARHGTARHKGRAREREERKKENACLILELFKGVLFCLSFLRRRLVFEQAQPSPFTCVERAPFGIAGLDLAARAVRAAQTKRDKAQGQSKDRPKSAGSLAAASELWVSQAPPLERAMIPPAEQSLVKYDPPRLISTSGSPVADPKSLKPKETLGSSQARSSKRELPPVESTSKGANPSQAEDILNSILPPREWSDTGQLWVQYVSPTPATRLDVINLQAKLDQQLEVRKRR